MHVWMYRMYVCMYVHMYLQYVCMYVCRHVSYVCMYVCMYVCILCMYVSSVDPSKPVVSSGSVLDLRNILHLKPNENKMKLEIEYGDDTFKLKFKSVEEVRRYGCLGVCI